MLKRARGEVIEVVVERHGAQEIVVRVNDLLRPAINFPALVGRVRPGDMVTLNTWAVEMGLGTGGVDYVTDADSIQTTDDPAGHLMKLRYTPLQHPVLCAESQESPNHKAVAEFQSLEASPVVCAELHSQLPAICAAAKWETKGTARIVYVMSDGAALPIALSRIVEEMRERNLIDATVTAGQAFGGDYEAVNIYSALAVARAAARADIIVTCQGPGNTGTSTSLGFSGIDQGIALNAATSLDGTAIAVVRMSFADERERHIGISHHTRTILARIALCPVLVPIPRFSLIEQHYWKNALDVGDLSDRHEFITVDAERGLTALIDSGIKVTTMGRGIDAERIFFLSAAAAGLIAGQWVTCRERNGLTE